MNDLSMSHPSPARGKHHRSRLENELRANLMRRTRMPRIIKSLCVKGKTEGSLDARSKRLSVT